MQLGESFQKALSLMAEYSTDGVLTPEGDNADYLLRMPRFADSAQKELATVKKIPATYTFSQNPIPNQLPILYAMAIKQHLNTDIIEQAVGSRAYYFEVDNIATIYIEECINGSWTVLNSINNTTKGQYTPYKGLVSPVNPNNQVRLRFGGQYLYNTRNRALYAYTFPTADDIPVYQRYVEYDMPADFYKLKKVMLTADPISYGPTNDYFWKNKRTLKANYFLSGEFEVHYFRYPTTITTDTSDSYEFEVDTDAQELIPLYIASKCIMDENQTLGLQLLNEFQVRLAMLDSGVEAEPATIKDVYGWA